MTWLAVLCLAALCFGGAFILLRGERQMWTSLLAALALGLAGYAWQASPDALSSPHVSEQDEESDNWGMVDDRKMMIGADRVSRNDKVLIADAFARRGQYADAVEALHHAVDENPQDMDAWLAMGIALAEHSQGVLTPAASFAFDQANYISPSNPAPGYFVGLTMIRRGGFPQAAQIWRQTLQSAGSAEEGYPFLAERLERLEGLIAQVEGNAAQDAQAEPAGQGDE